MAMIAGGAANVRGGRSSQPSKGNAPLLAALLATCLTTGCGDGAVEPIPPPAPVPTTITISPTSATLQSLGETVRLAATVQDQNGQTMSGATVAWASGDPSVATVDPSGLVTAVANGTASVTATAGSASASAAVTVDQVLAAVVVEPATDTLLAFGDTLWLSAEAVDANGQAVAGAEFAWASGDTLVATVDQHGLVTGISPGEVEVTASSADLTGRAQLAVLAPAPTAVAISPDTVGFDALGQTARLVAEVRDQAGRAMEDVAVSWSSGNPMVALVDSTGLVTAAGTGTTTIAATADSASGEATVTVTQSAGSVVLSPATDTIAPGDTLRMGAEAFDGNGHVIDATEFDWSSSDVSVVRVDAYGLATGVAEGRATVTAVAGDVHGTAEITVEYPDRAALVALYNATDGPNWVNSENWLTDAPLGEWYGVDTNASDRVTSLYFRGRWDGWRGQVLVPHGLSGPIPPALGDLTELRRVDFSLNRLSGPIPSELTSLINLERLALGVNDLSGPIPPELGNLVNLRYLSLGDNRLSGPIPSELGNLVKLEHLDLGNNGLSGPIPPGLGNLVNLYNLVLFGNSLSGTIPSELGNLVMLGSLYLNVNDLSGPIPPELGNLRQLNTLWLHYNEFSGPFPQSLLTLPLERLAWNCGVHGLCLPGTSEFVGWLEGIAKDGPFCNASDQATLTSLFDLMDGERWNESTGWLGGPALEEWHGVETDSLGLVTVLDLSDNGLSGGLPGGIANLGQLTRLRIEDNSLTGRLPLALTHLSLDELHYEGTELCEPADDAFRAWLDGIKSHRGTGKQCPPIAGDRDVLEALYEATGGANWRNDHNWLSEAPLGHWHGVQTDDRGRVVRLDLGWNGLSGVIPPELGGLDELRSLALYGNDLQGPIPPEIGELKSLVSLHLWGNGLSGAVPSELGNLASLRELRADVNRLSGPIPSRLGRLTRLSSLRFGYNDLSGPIPSALGNLSNLVRLELAENGLSGPIPSALGKLAKLEQLDLRQNGLVGPVPFTFGSLKQLRTLALTGNPEMSGALPASLTELRLDSLQAGGTDLCAPREPGFETWLRTLDEHWVAWCVDQPKVYLTQAVQSHAHPVPLVAGDDALLRVFVAAARETTAGMPRVRARFYLDGIERHVAEIPESSTPIPTDPSQADLSKSANAEIPGRIVRPGLEMVVEIDPDGTLDPGLGTGGRIPETGRMAVDVRHMPVLDLTMIPFLWSEDPDSAALVVANGMAADPEGHQTLEETRSLLPVDDIVVRAHEPVVTTSMSTWDVLPQVAAIRALEGGSGHYMGLASGRRYPIPTAEVGGWVGVSSVHPEKIAHELGHNMSLWHAPCGAAPGPDPSYPDPDGSIGAWGYDFRRGHLVPPDTPDLMSYCTWQWISSYHFIKALRYRLSTADAVAAAPRALARSLLLWGGLDPDGRAFLKPAFVADAPAELPDSAGDYTVAGRDASGAELFSLSFTMPVLLSEEDEIGSSFAFVLPVRPGWADALASITLSGPDGSVTLDGESDRPMAILRNPLTGQVRGFLSDLPQAAQAAMGAARRAAGPGMEVLFSRGVPDPSAWRP